MVLAALKGARQQVGLRMQIIDESYFVFCRFRTFANSMALREGYTAHQFHLEEYALSALCGCSSYPSPLRAFSEGLGA